MVGVLYKIKKSNLYLRIEYRSIAKIENILLNTFSLRIMKKKLLVVLLSVFAISTMSAQEVVKLWGGNPSVNNGLTDNNQVSNDSDPEIFIYKPDLSIDRNIAVVICPGGGYGGLAINHEGHEFAKWFQAQGITGIVLKYRLPKHVKTIPLDDLQQAIQYTRKNLSRNDTPIKVGVAGFSAGGHLASTASTHFNEQGTRPDFSILFYPVITMGEYTHQGSKNNLLGENPSANDVMFYSNETQITELTPPTILLLSDDDKAVLPMNSIMYYERLKQNNIPATMYIFPEGGHGWGMKSSFKYHTEMLLLLKHWLQDLK